MLDVGFNVEISERLEISGVTTDSALTSKTTSAILRGSATFVLRVLYHLRPFANRDASTTFKQLACGDVVHVLIFAIQAALFCAVTKSIHKPQQVEGKRTSLSNATSTTINLLVALRYSLCIWYDFKFREENVRTLIAQVSL